MEHLSWLAWAWKAGINLKMEMGWRVQAEQRAAITANQRTGFYVNEGLLGYPSLTALHTHLPIPHSVYPSVLAPASHWPPPWSWKTQRHADVQDIFQVIFHPLGAREASRPKETGQAVSQSQETCSLITYSWPTFSEFCSLQSVLTCRISFDSHLNSEGLAQGRHQIGKCLEN